MIFQRIVLVIVLLGAAQAGADLLVLDGGERLSGEVDRVTEGVLVFRTTLAGQMMLPMDTVQSLATERNLVISMRDETVYYGRFIGKDGRPHVQPLDGGSPQPIMLADITEALPIPSLPAAAEASEAEPASWRVSVGVGVLGQSRNEDHADAFTRLRVSGNKPTKSFDAEVLIERSDPGSFPRILRGSAEIRHKGNARLEPFARIAAERDTDAALDLRTDLTLGVGLPILQDENGSLEGLLGLNFTYEEWDLAELRGANGTRNERELNMQLGLRYSRILFRSVSFQEQLLFYGGPKGFEELRARSETALTLPLPGRLMLRFDLLVDFDNKPEFRTLDEWGTIVGASIQMDF